MTYGYCYDGYDSGWGGRAQPGVVNLRNVLLPEFDECFDLGILRDRSRCNQKRSAHCHGRAWDAGFPIRNGQAHAEGTRLADWLIANAQKLGVQRVIWNRWEWDSREGQRYKSPYNGASAHIDHVHVELCWDAARTLKAEDIDALLKKKEWDEMATKQELEQAFRGILAEQGGVLERLAALEKRPKARDSVFLGQVDETQDPLSIRIEPPPYRAKVYLSIAGHPGTKGTLKAYDNDGNQLLPGAEFTVGANHLGTFVPLHSAAPNAATIEVERTSGDTGIWTIVAFYIEA